MVSPVFVVVLSILHWMHVHVPSASEITAPNETADGLHHLLHRGCLADQGLCEPAVDSGRVQRQVVAPHCY